MEFLRGIPGTIGGAVRMNAGAYGREMADCLVEARVLLRDGAVETWSVERLHYSYRHSALPDQAIVLDAVVSGPAADPQAIAACFKT